MSKTKTGDSPAFAKAAFYHPEGGIDSPNEGLTKREYFAAMAMQGLLSNPSQVDGTNFEWVAEHSIGYADELLKQLDNEQ